MDKLEEIGATIEAAVAKADSEAGLEALRIAELGKKGRLTRMMRGLGEMEPQARREAGSALNQLKDRIAKAIARRRKQLADAALEAQIATGHEDMSLPPRPEVSGALHPVMQVFEEVAAIFADMGFSRAEGPEIEDDFHNFTALNFPADHPARQEQDTFFMAGDKKYLLRTHTSPVQIRVMQKQKPPLRLMAAGRVYRRDWDATHTPMFHQIEGLVIDQSSHMGHLKSCLSDFLQTYFGRPVETRFRPHFFPFTEPSAEMDVRCERIDGKLLVGSGPDWLEILGCGMVHPNVLTACGLDPKLYQGFAFGAGIDRLAMLKYGMADLRPFFEGDVEWTRHYGFSPFAPVY